MTYDSFSGKYATSGGVYNEGDLYYQINNGEVLPLTPVRTAETHSSYLGDWQNSAADPGWEAHHVLGFCIHQNTNNTQDYMFLLVYNDADVSANSWDWVVSFDTSFTEPPIQDDSGEFPAGSSLSATGGGNNTDAVGIGIEQFADTAFSFTLDFQSGTLDRYKLVEGPGNPSSETPLSRTDTFTIYEKF